jgi:hypothetical protein
LNAHQGVKFEPPEEKTILRFQDILIRAQYTAIIRRSKCRVDRPLLTVLVKVPASPPHFRPGSHRLLPW